MAEQISIQVQEAIDLNLDRVRDLERTAAEFESDCRKRTRFVKNIGYRLTNESTSVPLLERFLVVGKMAKTTDLLARVTEFHPLIDWLPVYFSFHINSLGSQIPIVKEFISECITEDPPGDRIPPYSWSFIPQRLFYGTVKENVCKVTQEGLYCLVDEEKPDSSDIILPPVDRSYFESFSFFCCESNLFEIFEQILESLPLLPISSLVWGIRYLRNMQFISRYVEKVNDMVEKNQLTLISIGFRMDRQSIMTIMRHDLILSNSSRNFLKKCFLRWGCANCSKTCDKRCNRCRQCFYCCKTCQTEHWNRGHGQDCRLYTTAYSKRKHFKAAADSILNSIPTNTLFWNSDGYNESDPGWKTTACRSGFDDGAFLSWSDINLEICISEILCYSYEKIEQLFGDERLDFTEFKTLRIFGLAYECDLWWFTPKFAAKLKSLETIVLKDVGMNSGSLSFMDHLPPNVQTILVDCGRKTFEVKAPSGGVPDRIVNPRDFFKDAVIAAYDSLYKLVYMDMRPPGKTLKLVMGHDLMHDPLSWEMTKEATMDLEEDQCRSYQPYNSIVTLSVE